MTTAPRPGGAHRRTATPVPRPALNIVVRAAPLGPAHRLGLDAVATRSGLHPDLVRRFVTLGLVDATGTPPGDCGSSRPLPPPSPASNDYGPALPLNYASLGLVLDLLDRISELEDALRRSNAGSRSERIVDTNRLTQKSQEALQEAQTIAGRLNQTEVDGEHLLRLLDQPDGLIPRLINQSGADTRPAHRAERGVGPQAEVNAGATPGQVYVTQRLAKVLDSAEQEAEAAQGRVRVRRAPGAGTRRRGLPHGIRPTPTSTASARTGSCPRSPGSAGTSASPRRRPKRRTRHWRSTAVTWSPRHAAARWTR